MSTVSGLPPLLVTDRAAGVHEAAIAAGCDALVVTDLVNVRWLTGFTGSSGRAVVRAGGVTLVTDGRYGEQARCELGAAGCPGEVLEGRTQAEQDEHLTRLVSGVASVGFEAEHVSVAAHDRLWALLGRDLVRTSGLVEDGRRVKDAAELARIERAAMIADAALADVIPMLTDRPTERELCDDLEAAMRRRGSDEPSFPTIIASGPNAAMAHHRPSPSLISEGHTVVMDFGATVDGYHSDITRTYIVGEPTPLQQEAYDVVLAAQRSGVAAVRPGATSAELDAACRDAIAAAGWGEWFVHGTGHGVGLRIHEAPWITRSHSDVVRVGDVLTVEPGVYRGDFGGVRIEDLVVVTDDGCRPLTRTPKDSPCPPSRPTT